MKRYKEQLCLLAAFLITSLSIGTIARAGDTAADELQGGVGMTDSGQFGLDRIPLPASPGRYVSFGVAGGYGLVESMGPVDGTHHRMQGSVTIGGGPIRQLGIGLTITGYRDAHPADALGEDTTAIGTPSLHLRGGEYLGNTVQLGAEIRISFPGNDAPSIDFSAVTAEMSALFAVAPKGKRWSIPLIVGYRLDNTADSAPDASSLRPGDRISLNASSFDAVIAGVGAAVDINRFSLYGEVAAKIAVGSNVPASATPVELALGGRVELLRGLELTLATRTLLTGRPDISPETPYAPTPPRFSILAGLTYTLGFDKKAAPKVEEKETVPEPTATPEPIAPQTATLSGQVQDEEGNPVGGASVTVAVDGESFTTQTESSGAYTLKGLPEGSGKLTIETPGFTPTVIDVSLSAAEPNRAPDTLARAPVETRTQLKGLVRSTDGTPLSAKVLIQPGKRVVKTDAEGYFVQDLDPGKYRVKISASGHRSQTKKVRIASEEVTILNVALTPVK